jgi:23S rRNA (adenine2030-N6)-methyltransferase
MNYRHIYHAGNFADVLKHSVLALILKALRKKDAPYCYLDTHAGIGRYDLHHEAAQKTGEYRTGIARLWNNIAAPAAVADYLGAVKALNSGTHLRYYPGSPRVARYLLRPQDRMVLLEKHPEEAAMLRQEFSGDRQVAVHEQDGYAGLKGFLPPAEKRGLVLIDPPYEEREEFDHVVVGLKTAYERWAGGVFAMWYPIKDRPTVERFHRRLLATGIRKILLTELAIYPLDNAFRLNGCGMIVVNAPWQLDLALETLVPELLSVLRLDHPGRVRVDWLCPE